VQKETYRAIRASGIFALEGVSSNRTLLNAPPSNCTQEDCLGKIVLSYLFPQASPKKRKRDEEEKEAPNGKTQQNKRACPAK
jgi:hypothetical protein